MAHNIFSMIGGESPPIMENTFANRLFAIVSLYRQGYFQGLCRYGGEGKLETMVLASDFTFREVKSGARYITQVATPRYLP